MRIALFAALARTPDGPLRADLMLAGRSVLGWQVAWAKTLGAERILCLRDAAEGAVLEYQHEAEAAGIDFHLLKGFAALPALVKANDDLLVLGDGIWPDIGHTRALIAASGVPPRLIAVLSGDHPLVRRHPEVFERIDAERHWAGFLVMPGAAVQKLADFPADSDAISVLLRLALQAGTPCRMASEGGPGEEGWVVADSAATVALHEQAVIAAASAPVTWQAPTHALAARTAGALARRGRAQGRTQGRTQGAVLAAGAIGVALLLAGAGLAAFGYPAIGLAAAAAGCAGAALAHACAQLAARIAQQENNDIAALPWLGGLVDAIAAAVMFAALAPGFAWAPLAVTGPLGIGLARLAAQASMPLGWRAFWGDRGAHLALMSAAAALRWLSEGAALYALAALAGLLVQARRV